MSSRQNPLHLSSCYCFGYRFWGRPIAFQGFVEISIFEIQHETKIHSLTGSEMDRGVVCFVGFRCFGNTSCSLHFAFICMHLPSCSFHLHACSFHCAFILFHSPCTSLSFVFISIHFPFALIPMCIHVLSSSFHLHAFSFHFAFMSFHFLSKNMEMA